MGAFAGRFSTLNSVLKNFSGVGAGAVGGFAALALSIKSLYDGAAELESTMFKLDYQIKLAGDRAGNTSQEINRFAGEMARSTLISKEAVLEASSTLLAFQSIGGALHERVLGIAVDITRAVGGSLNENIKQLGKAFDDPAANAAVLKEKVGGVTEEWIRHVKSVQESQGILAARNVLLEKLAGTLEGAAGAEAGGLKGAIHRVSEAWNEMRESIAKGLGLTSDAAEDRQNKNLDARAKLLKEILVVEGQIAERNKNTPAVSEASVTTRGLRAQRAQIQALLTALQEDAEGSSIGSARKKQAVQAAIDQAHAIDYAEIEAMTKTNEKKSKLREKAAEQALRDEEKLQRNLEELRIRLSPTDDSEEAKFLRISKAIEDARQQARKRGHQNLTEFAELQLLAGKNYERAQLEIIARVDAKDKERHDNLLARLKEEARTPAEKVQHRFTQDKVAVESDVLIPEEEKSRLLLALEQRKQEALYKISTEGQAHIRSAIEEIHIRALDKTEQLDEKERNDQLQLAQAYAAKVITSEEELALRQQEVQEYWAKKKQEKAEQDMQALLNITSQGLGNLNSAFSTYSQIQVSRVQKDATKQTRELKGGFDKELFALEDLHAAKTITDEEYSSRKKQIERNRTNAVVALETSLNARMETEGKKSFEIAKKIAIAKAVVDGISATVSAFKAGSEFGPVVGAAFAATAVAFTGAQIAALRASTFTGGSTPGVGGGSLPSAPSNESSGAGSNGAGKTVNIIFQGATYGFADFQSKVGEAVRANSDADVIMITSGSRQATEIRR